MTLVAILRCGVRIINVEHVLDVLRLILRSVTMRLRLVRQLYWSSSIEKLRGTIGRHILELDATMEATSHDLLVSDALAMAGLELPVRKYFTVEEGHVVWASSRETLIRV